MTAQAIVNKVTGKAVAVNGNDIDTDRIIPARFLRCVVFDGLGEHAFEDDRAQLKVKGDLHAFDKPQNQGASILFVNKNFGCGSSREHAPQALMRWGIKAIVGESFAEIFYGNCVSLGIPCVTVTEESIDKLVAALSQNPAANWEVDLITSTVKGPISEPCEIPLGVKTQFLTGRWNALNELLLAQNEIELVAQGLPYVSGW